MVSVDPMYVTFPVSQREFMRVSSEAGAQQPRASDFKVIVRFSNGTRYAQTGTINFVDVKVDRATDTVTVRATLPNPDGTLVDGQLVQVGVESSKQQQHVLIPQVALIADQEGPYVFIVDGGKAAIRRLKLGQVSGSSTIVQSGLVGGELVVVDGGQNLKPGVPVKAVPADKAAGRLTVFSTIFVDRPRLAIVIAIVTSIAGLLSLLAIPIAQLPDIVPPQVSVTATYPGASSEVVDATVAQVIESQVIGIDKMLYMKSISGNDGSYSLLASFELGTNPDINTVNVNNRVQAALSNLPDEVRRAGVRVQKRSSALLAVVALYSPKRTHDQLFLSNYVTINLLDQIKSIVGVGDARLFGPQDYAMRVWIKTDELTGLGLTTGDVISAIQSQNVQAAVGRIGARPIGDDQQLQLNIQTKGRLASVEEFENIIIRTDADRRGLAPWRHRQAGAGRRQSGPRDAFQRFSGRCSSGSTSLPGPTR